MKPIEKILDSALYIAREAPKQRGRYAARAQISWRHIERIREALAELGVDPQHWDHRGSLERLCRQLEEYHAH
uniref:Uncharacterized protein n=1 Tax=Meiothermus ruber TaxID=277 RepID=A0A7C3DQW9_MEIRU